jgi:Flp pilus assembly protein TadG
MFSCKKNWSDRRGTVAAVVAVVMPVMIGVAALGLDGGLLLIQRRQAQSFADAAALAGAYAIYNGSNFSTAQSAAVAAAAANGVTITTSNVTQPQSKYVSVSVTSTHQRTFSALWGAGTMSATASATARTANMAYSKAALLVLSGTGSSVTISGTTKVTAANGSVIVDSTSSAAVISSGAPSITTPELDLSGKISYSGTNPNNATTTKSNQPNTPDPLASIPAPTTSGLTTQSSSALSISSGTTTLSPGVYTGGITISGSAAVTLNPGVYYINGGGINMSGPSSLTGNGVFIYNTGGGAVNLSGTGSISLSPMTTGTYAGLSIFQDRTSTTGATLSGGSNISCSGTFYFPDATLTLSGTSGVATMGSQMIVNKITFSGGAGVSVNYNSNSVAAVPKLALVQ